MPGKRATETKRGRTGRIVGDLHVAPVVRQAGPKALEQRLFRAKETGQRLPRLTCALDVIELVRGEELREGVGASLDFVDALQIVADADQLSMSIQASSNSVSELTLTPVTLSTALNTSASFLPSASTAPIASNSM